MDASVPPPDTVLDWLANLNTDSENPQARDSLTTFSKSPAISAYFELVSIGQLSVDKLAHVLAGLSHMFGGDTATVTPRSWSITDPNWALGPYAQLAVIQDKERKCMCVAVPASPSR